MYIFLLAFQDRLWSKQSYRLKMFYISPRLMHFIAEHWFIYVDLMALPVQDLVVQFANTLLSHSRDINSIPRT